MRLEDTAAGADHVAFMEAVEGHVFNLSLSDFQKSICHGTIVTLFITGDWRFSNHVLGHTCTLTGHFFLTRGGREELRIYEEGVAGYQSNCDDYFWEEEAGLHTSVLLPHVRTLIFPDCRLL